MHVFGGVNLKYGVVHTRGGDYRLYYRLVWSTAFERRVLSDAYAEDLEKIAYDIVAENDKNIKIVEWNVVEEHYVDCIVTAPPKVSLFVILSLIKGRTGKLMSEKHPELRAELYNGKLWNRSYFVETVGTPTKVTVTRYLQNQSRGKNPAIDLETGEALPSWMAGLSEYKEVIDEEAKKYKLGEYEKPRKPRKKKVAPEQTDAVDNE